MGLFAFVEMLIFLGILFVGYAYVWVKGDLDWDRPEPFIPVVKTPSQSKQLTTDTAAL
jgi:NADH-quinone oxidoreductase subunit A